MDNCGGQSYDGAGNMAGRYAGVLTLIQHQFPKFILLLDKFLLVETSHTNCWIHPCVHTHRANLNPSGKFVADVLSPFRGGMFFKSVSHGRLSSSAYSWLSSYNTEDRARETIFQTTTPQGKPCSILSKPQYCVSHEVFFFVEVS